MFTKTSLLFHSKERDFLEGRKPIPSSYRFFPFERLPSRLNLGPALLSVLLGFLFIRTVFIPQNHVAYTVIGFVFALICWMIAYRFIQQIRRRNYLLQHPNDPFFRRGFYAHESHWMLWTQHQLKGTWEQLEVECMAPSASYGYWRYYLIIATEGTPVWIPCQRDLYFYVKTTYKEPEHFPHHRV